MPNHLSILGIIHTAISIAPLIIAFVCISRKGIIDPTSRLGRWYVVLTYLTCITGFPIMKTGHLSPAHYLTIVVLILLTLAILTNSFSWPGNKAIYFQTGAMSTTLFLSFVPAINETLTRLPVDHPLAAGPDDPLVRTSLTALFVLYILGISTQFFMIRKKVRHQIN